ncbi:MAG: helix-turn-helix domain-containing protein [Thalassovita sp.]
MTADISKIVTDDPMDTLPIQQFLTYRLSRVQAKLNAQAARMLRETSGVTLTQWRIIAVVGTSGQTRLSEIARATALDKGLLSRNLATLIDEKIIQATPG